eukprot:COSAG01_NODE_8040_length_2945_cov_2.114195_1_plen_532_part_01
MSRTFVCTCVAGWRNTNGRQDCAINIDECASYPCQNGGSCVDLVDAYVCACISGFHDAVRNGVTHPGCEDRDVPCALSEDHCSSHSQCRHDAPGVYHCECHPGYSSDYSVRQCSMANYPCTAASTDAGGDMMNVDGGGACLEIDECHSSPCENSWTTSSGSIVVANTYSCNDFLGFYTCTCQQGYAGYNCDVHVDACISHPCQNGATCITLVSQSKYRCTCTLGFGGVNCDVAELEVVELANGNGVRAMCFPVPHCAEFVSVAPEAILSGCLGGGTLGSACVVDCMQGYVATHSTPGSCILSLDGKSAEYVGQSVTCEPEASTDGSFSHNYCVVEADQIISRDCCDGLTAAACAVRPPSISNCTITCAEAWLPLWGGCEQHLADFTVLSTSCEATAENILSGAPPSLTIAGLTCHSLANGLYEQRVHTVSAKPAWSRTLPDGQRTVLFFRETPDRWCLAQTSASDSGFDPATSHCFGSFDSYADLPPWHASTWNEECAGRSVDANLNIDPGYTQVRCQQAFAAKLTELRRLC